jgi:hypothetical protein
MLKLSVGLEIGAVAVCIVGLTPRKVKGFDRRRASVDAAGCAGQASRTRIPGWTATAAGR